MRATVLAAVAFLAPLAVFRARAEKPACTFEVEPVFPGYFWDPSCTPGALGCSANGADAECRFCGAGSYANVSCPPSSCHFPSEPFVPYYWDPSCEMGVLGCWADGVHAQCRFCGEAPYTSITCPDVVGGAVAAACTFANEPRTSYYWDPSCEDGMRGCLADGVHEKCRFCGEGNYSDLPCPSNAASQKCTFANEPTVPYYWDADGTVGMLGCLADGVHPQCRLCAQRPFEGILCPASMQLPTDRCNFPAHSQPRTSYFWDSECEMGILGCWADGFHAECCFCGSGVYHNITCPSSATFPSGSATGGGPMAPAEGAKTAEAAAAAPASALAVASAEAQGGPAAAAESAPGKARDRQPAAERDVQLAGAFAAPGLGARSLAGWVGAVSLARALHL